MNMRVVDERPSSNGSVSSTREHGSIKVGRCGRRDVLKPGFVTVPNDVAPPEAVGHGRRYILSIHSHD